jgi:hypothetical protein
VINKKKINKSKVWKSAAKKKPEIKSHEKGKQQQ